MIRCGKISGIGAAVWLALAFALGTGGKLACPAQAQDRLPSVSDYRLPSQAAPPRPRAQGPVDGSAPVVIAPPTAQPAPETSAPAATASPVPKARPSQAARAPAPRASTAPAANASASPSAAASARPAAARPAAASATSAPQAVPSPAPSAAIAPVAASPAPANSAPANPAPGASAAPIDWHVHSAAEVIAKGSGGSWLWPTVAAFLLGAAAMLLAQQMLRRKKAAAASAIESAIDSEPDLPAAAPPPAPPPAQPGPQTALPSTPEPLDLLSIMAEPEHVAPAPVPAQPSPAAMANPAVRAEPLTLELSARRLSATLMNTTLNYELTINNTGPEAIRSIIIGGDMIGAHASLPSRAQLELSGNNIMPLHTIAALAPGESVVLKGEFKLALAAITPIRNGNAALFIPLARFRLEAIGRSALPFAISRTFVVGEDQDRPGAALRPFRLDLGPRLYSQIGQRELALTA